MKKELVSFFAILSVCSSLAAQEVILTGSASDINTGERIPGVIVVDLSSMSGTSTGEDGTFKQNEKIYLSFPHPADNLATRLFNRVSVARIV